MHDNDTLDAAKHAMDRSYSPYSNFRVGSAIKVGENHFSGANIENASYSLTMCAERVALYQAMMAGADMETVTEVAIASDSESIITPCGACRQVMIELLPPDVQVIMSNTKGRVATMRVDDLLPGSFDRGVLSQG